MKRTGSLLERPTKKANLQRQPSVVLGDVIMADRFGGRRPKSSGVGLAPEKKYNDVTFNADATTTGSIVALNQMAAGDTALLRDGNKILMKSIQLRFTTELESLAQNAVCRFMIVYDKQTNLVNPTIAGAGTGPLDSIAPTSLRQIATTSRFKILKDMTFAINSTSNTAGALQIQYHDAYVKIPNDCQFCQFADGAAGAPNSGGLYLMFFSNIAAGATDVNVVGQARLRFFG